MSLLFVIPLVAKGYGLKDEDLTEILILEKLKDVTTEYLEHVADIQHGYGSCKNESARIQRVIRFISGANRRENIVKYLR